MRSGNRYRRLDGGGGLAWASQYIALDGTRPAIIADFNRGLYAVPMGLTSSTAATAGVDQLTRLRAATFEEVFAFVATSTTARGYIDQSAVFRNNLAANVPRFTFQNGKRQLALDNQVTNFVPYSTATSDASWVVSNCTKTSGQADPSGGTGASLITASAGTASKFVYAGAGTFSYTSGTTYTVSYFVKAGTQSLVQLSLPSAAFGTGQYANFDITNDTLGTVSGGTAKVTRFPDGSRRIEFTAAATVSTTATAGVVVFIASLTDARVPTVSLTTNFTIWGAQVEAQPFASAFIPTEASSVTRAIETCQVGALAQAIVSRAAGTIVVRGKFSSASDALSRAIFGNDGTGPLLFAVYGSPALLSNWNGTLGLNVTLGSGTFNTTSFGAALAFDGTGRAISGNRAATVSDAQSVAAKAVTYLGRSGVASIYGDGFYDALVIYPARVAAGALQSLAVAL